MIPLSKAIDRYVHDEFFFVQIGANDGNKNDPIKESIEKYDLSGLCVEPVGRPFNRLKRRYRRNPKILLENSAISDREGKVTLYRDRKNDKLCSLRMPKRRRFARRMYEIEVEAMRLLTLIRKHNVNRIDLLQIDIEGMDDMVVYQINDLSTLPTIVNFEFEHLSKERTDAVVSFLRSKGYETIDKSAHGDIIAIRGVL
jgi:FkbM family methyltransferase